MAKSKYSWSGHNEFYRMDSKGRVTTIRREPCPKDFSKAIIAASPGWIERPEKEKPAKAKK